MDGKSKDVLRREAWNERNTVLIGLRLHRKTDRDILEWLEGRAALFDIKKQTEIKRLIRIGMEVEKNNLENRTKGGGAYGFKI